MSNKAEALAQMLKDHEAHAKMMQAQGLSRASPRVYTLQEKMEMRMSWVPDRLPSSFASVEYHRLNDKVFVWVLTKEEQSVVLEDEHALFPSDTLITKVRMMGG